MSRCVWISYPSLQVLASIKRTPSGTSIDHPEGTWKTLGSLLVWQLAIETQKVGNMKLFL